MILEGFWRVPGRVPESRIQAIGDTRPRIIEFDLIFIGFWKVSGRVLESRNQAGPESSILIWFWQVFEGFQGGCQNEEIKPLETQGPESLIFVWFWYVFKGFQIRCENQEIKLLDAPDPESLILIWFYMILLRFWMFLKGSREGARIKKSSHWRHQAQNRLFWYDFERFLNGSM